MTLWTAARLRAYWLTSKERYPYRIWLKVLTTLKENGYHDPVECPSHAEAQRTIDFALGIEYDKVR